MNIHAFYRYTFQASVISAIGNVPYRGGELTDIVDLLSVLKMITGVYNPVISDRLLVQNVVILVTDGVPNFPSIAYSITSALYQLTRQVALFAVCNTKGTPESPGCTEECARGVASFPQTVRFIHSVNFYSASSSSLLLRGVPDYSTDTVLNRIFTP